MNAEKTTSRRTKKDQPTKKASIMSKTNRLRGRLDIFRNPCRQKSNMREAHLISSQTGDKERINLINVIIGQKGKLQLKNKKRVYKVSLRPIKSSKANKNSNWITMIIISNFSGLKNFN